MPSSIKRSAGLTGAATCMVVAAAFAQNATTSAPAAPRPNILFIFTDDHAAQAISAYGSRINRTPQLDRLAAGGMRFDRCYATNPICAPSRAVILTGKHSHRNGVIDNIVPFDDRQATFPNLLKEAGYQTALIGKWHLKTDPVGFEHWQILPGQGQYYNPDFITRAGRARIEGYTTDLITDLTLDWLRRQRDPARPFLLMCQHKAPHREWMPGPRQLSLYRDADIPEPANLFDDYTGRNSGARTQEMSIAEHLRPAADLKLPPAPGEPEDQAYTAMMKRLTPQQRAAWNAAYAAENDAFRAHPPTGRDLVRWNYQRYIKDYLRCVAAVDDSVGRLLDALDELGLAGNTVVIYSSDQGFFLGEHGWYDKRWMYEESSRMPLMVRWAGVIKPGAINTHLVQNLDFAPTLLDLAGVPVPPDMQGRSLLPLLHGRSADWRDAIYCHYFEYPGTHSVPRFRGIRTERYKLIHYHQLDEWELFDLQEDPQEMHNLYADPAQADRISELKARLQQLREECGDTDTAPGR